MSPISRVYKIILDPQKTFKSDGVISPGKRIHFRNGIAQVDEETLVLLKQRPEYGVDFIVMTDEMRVPEAVQVMPMGLGSEMEKENQKGQFDMLSRQVSMLTEAVGQILENMKKHEKVG